MQVFETGAALTLSAVAFAGLVGAATAAQPTEAPIAPEPVAEADVRGAPAEEAETVEALLGALPLEGASAPEPPWFEGVLAAAEEPPVPEGMVRVPDFDGLTAREAWRLGRERGLRVMVRDPDGYRLDQWDGARYVVGSEPSVAPGSVVERRSLVRLRSRLRPGARVVSGY